MTVFGARRLWRFVPLGTDELQVLPDQQLVRVTHHRLGCLATSAEIPVDSISDVQVARARVNLFTLLRDLIAGFFFGFLLHLLPAQVISVPESLGSSETHRRLGMVWGAIWLASFLVLSIGLRPWVLRIRSAALRRTLVFQAGGSREQLELCVPGCTGVRGGSQRPLLAGLFAGGPAAMPPSAAAGTGGYQPVDAGLEDDLSEAEKRRLEVTRRPGWFTLMSPRLPLLAFAATLLLMVNAVVVFMYVQKCLDCGGCRDSGPPRPGCYSGM